MTNASVNSDNPSVRPEYLYVLSIAEDAYMEKVTAAVEAVIRDRGITIGHHYAIRDAARAAVEQATDLARRRVAEADRNGEIG